MTGLEIFTTVLTALAGMGVFLYGMKLMGDSLENVAGNKIKTMFRHIDKNMFIGVGIGAGTTAVIQSSAAVTVMLIGFVNSGLMTLTQATTIIYGANIGTTVTAQLVALGYGGIQNFDLTAIFAACAGVGAFMILFFKKDIVKKIGAIICGLGMIFVGLSVMGDSMSSFKESPAIVNALASLQSPFLLLIMGILVTALIQSSSAVSGLVITMSVAGILSFPQAMYIIVGSNIGTCVTALLCALGTSTNAKRVAIVHLLFNVIGSVLFMLTDLFAHYADILIKLFTTPQTQIAMLHTFFNVSTVIVLLPFTKVLVKLAVLIVPDKKTDKETPLRLYYLSERILSTPPLAAEHTKLEILHMLSLAKSNLDLAFEACLTLNLSKAQTLAETETVINYLNREVTKFLVKIMHTDVSETDLIMLGTAHHTVSDIERIGDYAENLMEYAQKLKQDELTFSEESLNEIKEVKAVLDIMFEMVVKIYAEESPELIPELYKYEQQTDDLKVLMGSKHIERLEKGTCSPEVGAVYLNLASDCERVADHLTNIANATKSFARPKKKTPAVVTA